jgi:hypothetical protein
MKQADLGNMFRKAFRSVCTSTIVVSSDSLPSINVLSFEDTRKQKRILNQQVKEISKWITPLISSTAKI